MKKWLCGMKECCKKSVEQEWQEIINWKPFLHWCRDWDFLLIDTDDGEFKHCSCFERDDFGKPIKPPKKEGINMNKTKVEKMAKKVKVIEWETNDNSSDGTPVYRLDEKGAGDRLFRDILNNFELSDDDNHTLKIVEMTPAEWKKCEKNGNDLA